MVDWSLPVNTSNAVDVLPTLNTKVEHAASLNYPGDTQIPEGALMLDRSTFVFRERQTGAWVTRRISASGIADLPASKITSGVFGLARIPAIDDSHHGNRGGRALHSAATSNAAGFMSAGDKTKLDSLSIPAIVAFRAVRLQSSSTLANIDTYTFTYNNEGEWFNITTGEFATPFDGIYHFNGMMKAGISNPGSVLGSISFAQSSLPETSGAYHSRVDIRSGIPCTIGDTIKLNQGEIVKMVWRNGSTVNAESYRYSFSGHLVARL